MLHGRVVLGPRVLTASKVLWGGGWKLRMMGRGGSTSGTFCFRLANPILPNLSYPGAPIEKIRGQVVIIMDLYL